MKESVIVFLYALAASATVAACLVNACIHRFNQ